MTYSLGEYEDEMRRLSGRLDESLEELRQQAFEKAHKEAIYRQAKAEAWTRYSMMPFLAREKEALVNAEVRQEGEARDIAAGLKEAALESVRSRRAQLSALQSLLAGYRAEAEMARYGPDFGS
jgi:hypothetical protein